MKKIIKIILPLILIILLFVGCGAEKSTVEDNSRFKSLDIKYNIEDPHVPNIKIICDTKTGLLYLTANSASGGISPFNQQVINHNGDTVDKQYTLDEYQQTQTTKIQLK